MMGDNPPTAEDLGNALKAVRDATFDAASAEMRAAMPKPRHASHHQSTPGRVSLTIRGAA